MKITKVKISNLFGIKDISLDGKSITLAGDNGTGKSSVIDSVKLALTNKSKRGLIIRKGESEGEVLIETDTGLSIHRKFRDDRADYKLIKENGKEVKQPESFLSEIFTNLQLNPVDFMMQDAKEQNRIILDLIEYAWDMSTIKEWFGEIPPDERIEWSANILEILNKIQAEDGYYFRKRQDLNRDARNKRSFIAEIAKDIPLGYNAKKWIEYNLGDKYKELEHTKQMNSQIEKAKAVVAHQTDKMKSFDFDREIAKIAIEKEIDLRGNKIKEDVAELKARVKELEVEKSGLEEKKADKIAVVEAEYNRNIAEFTAQIAEYEEIATKEKLPTEELSEEVQQAETMKSHLNEYNRMITMQGELDSLLKRADEITTKIEKARYLPSEILEECELPIEGLEVVDGEPRINGIPVSGLSDGEQLQLVCKIATHKVEGLQLVLIDRFECLSKKNQKKLVKELKSKDVQIIGCRTNEKDIMEIIEL